MTLQLSVKEMGVLCAFHAGTLSATLELLREAERIGNVPPERMDTIKSVVEKLSGLKDGETIALAFEPEK